MIYNTSKEDEKKAAQLYFERLLRLEKKIEVKEVRKKRSTSQNGYLHLLFRWFGLEFGYDAQTVKDEFFKRTVNREIFEVDVAGSLGKFKRLKSTSELDTLECTLAIEKFRNWSLQVAGVYLPEPNEEAHLDSIRNEMEKYENAKFS